MLACGLEGLQFQSWHDKWKRLFLFLFHFCAVIFEVC
jgi:hypothetical protein